MTHSYHPPCTITPAMLSMVATIAERIGQRQAQPPLSLQLRCANRVRTIQGSLAIEGNTLSEEKITAILEGKRVIAPPREIQEVRNAIQVYEQLTRWNPLKEGDLLSAHALLMEGLLDQAGQYRQCSVGVMGEKEVVHIAPPASRVADLMGGLWQWLEHTDLHPLVASTIFHYEFEFIHPFEDGNGRMGRLWQALLLHRWHPLFAYLPIESMIFAQQQNYYQALNQSSATGDSAPFLAFMLQVILMTIDDLPQDTPQASPQDTPQVNALLTALKGTMSRSELMAALELTDRKSFRQRYLQPALQAGWIAMTLPDKPNSPLQQYHRLPTAPD